jgi:hypothetical protein
MVRILKVKELEERKKSLLVRSEIYRQTLKLEMANAEYSAALVKKRFHTLRRSCRLIAAAVPLAALLLAQKRLRRKGFLSHALSGLRFFNRIASFLGEIRSRWSPGQPRETSEPAGTSRFS